MARALFIAFIVLVTQQASIAAPVQWAGNGHWYDLVQPSGGITWPDARDAAAAATHLGLPGHLATVTSSLEHEFVVSSLLVPNAPVPTDWSLSVWIGLTDASNEGQFTWVTGEPFAYTAWFVDEPNNLGDEDFVHYQRYTSSAAGWGWNDHYDATISWTSAPFSYLVEFEAAPEPSSLVLAFMGSLGLAGCGGRRGRRARATRPQESG